MKKAILSLALLGAAAAYGQSTSQPAPYWQQSVSYKIDVSLNDKEHSLRGNAGITYVNNSPDALDFIWIHCWPNAYKNDQTAYAKQLMKEKDGSKRLKALKDRGSMDSLSFTVNGMAARLEPHPEWIDVVKLVLPAPLRSGDSVRIQTPFYTKLPTYNSRSGHDGQSYMACQWYPKAAVYDRKGWHPMPYLDQGEFYNEFGNYDVSITLPGSYVVGATGVLQNADERARYVTLGNTNRLDTHKDKNYSNDAAWKTLQYRAEDVTDFAWFADKKFIIEHDSLEVVPGKKIDVFAFHRPNTDPGWQESTEYIKSAVRNYSDWIGAYPYPVVQAVQGPGNDMSGGMEYPMITLITMPGAVDSTLDVVITHEVGHNWFPMVVSTNEREFAWMDEGFNSYYENMYSAEKYGTFGGANTLGIPAYLQSNPDELRKAIYRVMNQLGQSKEPINQPSYVYKSEDDYGEVTYQKTAIWLYHFEQQLTKFAFLQAMRQYFDTWKFRHPYPEDFRASMESYFNTDLKKLFDGLDTRGPFAD